MYLYGQPLVSKKIVHFYRGYSCKLVVVGDEVGLSWNEGWLFVICPSVKNDNDIAEHVYVDCSFHYLCWCLSCCCLECLIEMIPGMIAWGYHRKRAKVSMTLSESSLPWCATNYYGVSSPLVRQEREWRWSGWGTMRLTGVAARISRHPIYYITISRH